jgi:hypothetical protein
MKRKINFCMLFLILASINSFAQKTETNNSLHLTKEQQYKDSIDFAKFKQKHPEDFLNERLPTKLLDDSYVIGGFSTAIRIKNNHVKDSVYHNFNPEMPDTTTVIPFNDIKVTDSKINIDLFSHLIMMGGKDRDSAEITSLDPDYWPTAKISKLPFADFYFNSTAIKISINGKLLFDWQILNSFPKHSFKASEKFNVSGGSGSSFGFYYGYDICDTTLNINDQLLIEIKNIKNNWMIDRYNITRVAASPNISAIIPINENKNQLNNFINFSQKKTSFLNPAKEK